MFGFLVILLVLLLLLTGMSVWAAGYVFEEQWTGRVRKGILFFDFLAILGLLAGSSLFRGMAWAGPALRLVSIVFMVQFFLCLLVLPIVLLRWGYRRIAAVPMDLERRKLLQKAAVFPAAATAAGFYGGLYEKDHTVERCYSIPVPTGSGLDGCRAAQISDVHLGLFFSLKQLEQLLERIAAAKPDALFITGDLFDDVAQNEAAASLVDRFCVRFPLGIWYCRGNHEHMRGMERIESYLQKTRIHELVNSSVLVKDGAMPLYFAGVDYPMERSQFERLQAAYSKQALAGIPTGAVTILLAHHPNFIDDGAARGVKLILTGHTHGAQIGFFGVPLFPVFKYTRGMYRKGESYGYVHSGNGSWFPYRFGCPPEIAYFRLQEEKG